MSKLYHHWIREGRDMQSALQMTMCEMISARAGVVCQFTPFDWAAFTLLGAAPQIPPRCQHAGAPGGA